jgi:hypothetical protein
MLFQNVGTILASFVKYETVADRTISIAEAILFSATTFFLKLIAPPIALDRAGEEKKCLSSDSLLMQAEVSLQAENSSMHAVRRSIRIKNENLPAKLPKSCLASDSLRENAVEKTHISPGFLPLHRPAVAGPAARELKCTRESTRILKQTMRFSP